jgi:hypothetical protein
MQVLHDDELIDLSPVGLPRVVEGDSCVLLELWNGKEKEEEQESIFLRVPNFAADFEKVRGYEYIASICKSNYWQEGDYAEVRLKVSEAQKPVGFVFPASTLYLDTSNLCSEGQEVGSAYAWAGVLELLKSSRGQASLVSISWGETYSLQDFYGDDLVVAVYGVERLAVPREQADELVEEFLVSLAEINVFDFEVGELKEKNEKEPFNKIGKIYVRSIDPDLKKACFCFLKEHVLPANAIKCDPIVRFFLQYQFFEILMHNIFASVVKDFLKVVSSGGYASDAWKTRELVSDLGKKSAEGYRIKRVFNFLRKEHSEEVASVEQACSVLLDKVGKNPEASEKNKYYLVRNLVFHGFGNGVIARGDIDSICEPVAKVIYKLALGFQDVSPYFGEDEED